MIKYATHRAYDAGYLAFLEGKEPSHRPPVHTHYWHRGYDAARADQERQRLATEGEMPEEQIAWIADRDTEA